VEQVRPVPAGPGRGPVAPDPGDISRAVCSDDAREDRATMTTAPSFGALPSGRAPAADRLPAAVDPSTASFRAVARQVRAMGLLDRRPRYYTVKITLTIAGFFAGWALFVLAGNS
jgi:hypothetical protein